MRLYLSVGTLIQTAQAMAGCNRTRIAGGIAVGFSLLCAGRSAGQDPEQWEQTRNKEGIVSYIGRTRTVNGFIPTKAEMGIGVPAEACVRAVTDFDEYTRWIPYCTASRTLERLFADECYAYYYISPPMSTDRDIVVHSTVTRTGEGAYDVVIEGVPGHTARVKGVIRVPFFLSRYHIAAYGNGGTRITHVNEIDLGGSIPEFLHNWSKESQPWDTMRTLRECILSGKL